ncbi:TasA family protein [Agromyces sp. S2-1-8]|uniref:TasA family protein n=1 Tax=Agromyces sp. S2-1-8 TaxID=2897180 RepID=UPI001E55FE00|nr:TasA family protein [Agromyces sp. S2-1-8]MCD5348456.1 CalY family protein [Agromyces sp. S2-1-8]
MAVSISSRTKLFAAMGIIVVAAAGVTLAAFTDSGNVETTFTAGTLDLKFDDDQDGNPDNYLVDFSTGFDNLAPGDTVTRDLLVYNSGTIDAIVELAVPTVTNSAGSPVPALQDSLVVTITDVETVTELYNGPLAGAAFTGLDIGAGGTPNGKTLRISVTLDAAAPIGVAGQSVDVVLPFTAAQA